MQSIRVLLIAPSMEIIGGQAVQAARILAEMRSEPAVAMRFQPINPPLPEFIRQLKFVRTIAGLALYIPAVAAGILRSDIVHLFTAAAPSYNLWSLPAIFIGRLFGKKIILNYHDGRCEEHLTHWRSAIPTIRLVDAIVTPSGYLVDVFAKFGLRAQCIFNLINTNDFLRRRRSHPRPVFMTNRMLEPLYNVACILRAFQRIQRQYPEASLTIAHDGVCRSELEKQAANLGLRNTQFIGHVPAAKVADLYDAAEIYITTPNIDCMPLSLLECFASGLPVIATKAGGIPYIATNETTALLVGLNDDEAVARCAIRLLEEPGLAERLADNGWEEVKRYNGHAIRLQWTALYRSLMAAR